MKQYLHIIQKELSSVSENDLFTPIKQTHIDSLDVIVIRVALEKYFGIEVSDTTWYKYQTLADALEYFHKNGVANAGKPQIETTEIINSEVIEIRMPQMSNRGLSESWLLKYLGDKHWLLLSDGFNKKSSEFEDETGNRLYPTFVRISYNSSALYKFNENDLIEFSSNINGFGANTFISNIIGISDLNKITATLLTTFSIRLNDNNSEMNKGNIKGNNNSIIQITKTPTALNDYRLLRKGLVDEIVSEYGVFPIVKNVLFTCLYDINPYHDINGVGLLYFAAYPIISDSCILKYFKHDEPFIYQTIYRDIFYFSNCNPSDKIIFQLNFFEKKGNIVRTLTSLLRQSDNRILAKILTVKQVNDIELTTE